VDLGSYGVLGENVQKHTMKFKLLRNVIAIINMQLQNIDCLKNKVIKKLLIIQLLVECKHMYHPQSSKLL
jgi:hypothetical protein